MSLRNVQNTTPSSLGIFDNYLELSIMFEAPNQGTRAKAMRTAPAQIYIFTIYPGPKFTQPTFTQNPQLHNTKFTRDPNLHEPIFSQPKIYTTRFYTNQNIHSHKITPNPIFTEKIYTGPNFTQPRNTIFPVSIFSCPHFLPGQNCRGFRH